MSLNKWDVRFRRWAPLGLAFSALCISSLLIAVSLLVARGPMEGSLQTESPVTLRQPEALQDTPESSELQPTPETAQLGPLTVITRAGWGARPLNPNAPAEFAPFDPQTNPGGLLVYPTPLADWYRSIVVHHTALPLSDGPVEIQDLHMDERGYADIAYHFVIGRDGSLYAGRALEQRGAHVAGYNTGSIGIVLIGNFETIEPTTEQLAALDALVAYLAQTYPLTHLAGHKDFNPGDTQCPGAALYPFLPDLAARHNLAYGTGGYRAPAWQTQAP